MIFPPFLSRDSMECAKGRSALFRKNPTARSVGQSEGRIAASHRRRGSRSRRRAGCPWLSRIGDAPRAWNAQGVSKGGGVASVFEFQEIERLHGDPVG